MTELEIMSFFQNWSNDEESLTRGRDQRAPANAEYFVNL